MKISRLYVSICLLFLSFLNVYGQSYNELAKIIAFDREVNDEFGSAVANSNDYAVFGAPSEDHDVNGNNPMANSGAVYVISRATGAMQKLVASDRQVAAAFGISVSIYQDIIIVGAHGNATDITGGNNMTLSGAAYIFKLQVGGTWTEIQKLTASDRAANSYFGFSTSMSNGNIVIGASREEKDANGLIPYPQAGAVYVFQQSAGLWVESQKITPQDRFPFTRFGYSLDVNDGLLIIGSQLDPKDFAGNNHLTYAGSAHVFKLDAGNSWVEVQKLTASDRGFNDIFGSAVAISGDFAIVGAPFEDEDVTGANTIQNAGAAYIFKKNVGGIWSEVQKLNGVNRGISHYFGWSVDLINDLALVGAPEDAYDSNGNNYQSEAGAVEIIKKDVTNFWQPIQKLTNSDRRDGDRFGTSVSMSDYFLVCGAPNESEDQAGNNSLSRAGSSYIFAMPFCIDPDVPTLSATAISCPGDNVTITINGNLNNAIFWAVYEGGCGATMVEGTNTNSVTLATSGATTTYYIRGEDVGGCVDESTGACAMITVIAQDNVPPVAICQDITVSLDANGEAFITASDVDGGSYDNCGIELSVVAPNRFDCSDIGTNIATIQMNDASGNGAFCNATVTVVDHSPPVAICQDITINLDANGDAFITASDVDGGSYDNCGIDLSVVAPTHFDCTNIGANTATIQMNDANGNGAFCNAIVTVVDNIPPTANCKDITVSLDANGEAFITAIDVDGGFYDNCGIALAVVAPNHFDCSDIGANIATVQMHDANGNGSTCDATVTVVDDSPPVAICQDITVSLDSNGEAFISASDVDGGSYDNCGIDLLVIAPSYFDTSDLGANTVTIQMNDAHGNAATCNAIVTVVPAPIPASRLQPDVALKLFPNPATDYIQLTTSSNIQIQQIIVYTISGKQCLIVDSPQANNNLEINTSNLASGAYFVSIETGGLPIFKKFIKN